MTKRRQGRGRLSSIDKIADEAREDVDWAIEELKAHRRPQEDIREEFNLRLCSKGLSPVSRSAFNRYSLKLSRHSNAMREVREVARIWAERMDAEPDGDVGLLINETLKALVYDAISDLPMDGDGGSLKMLGTAALTLQRLERARGTNFKTAALKRDKFLRDVSEKVEERMRERGMSQDSRDYVVSQILGVPEAEQPTDIGSESGTN